MAALRRGKILTCGNARTDGKFYYLFDQKILSVGPPNDEMAVRYRIKGWRNPESTTFFTYAGWATQSTARHLGASRLSTVRFGVRRGVPVVTFNGFNLELDKDRWYCTDDLSEMIPNQRKEAA